MNRYLLIFALALGASAVVQPVRGANGQDTKATVSGKPADAKHHTAASEHAHRIPLCPGLQIVTAVNQANGDYESIKTIESVTPTAIRIRYSAEQMVTDFLSPDFGKVSKTTVWRNVRREDLASATFYQQRYFSDMPEDIPQSTAIGVSKDVLTALKNTGRAELTISNAYSGNLPADRNVSPNLYDFQVGSTLERVPVPAVKLPVLLNGVATELHAIHARADFVGDKAEFFFLDDPENPLTLKFRIGIGAVLPMVKEQIEQCTSMQTSPELAELSKIFCGRSEGGDSEVLQVVKITHRCAAASPSGAPSSDAPLQGSAAEIEEALATTGTFDVYDIYFSFNSDRIRDESIPRLTEIAAVLRKHPEWTLALNGHTDGIGSDEANLLLSRRRAAAVRAALVSRHGVTAARLETAGFGEAQPRDTNSTVEGRARNRRVELTKR